MPIWKYIFILYIWRILYLHIFMNITDNKWTSLAKKTVSIDLYIWLYPHIIYIYKKIHYIELNYKKYWIILILWIVYLHLDNSNTFDTLVIDLFKSWHLNYLNEIVSQAKRKKRKKLVVYLHKHKWMKYIYLRESV